jgi:Holliday junction resolvase-like predicted endonuclease
MKESDIQHSIITWLESIGMYVVKVIQTNKNGWPDLQALQNGVTLFIEVKTPTGKLSELQKYRHKQLQDKGFIVITTHSLTHLQNELITIGTQIQEQRIISNLN